VVRFPKPSVGPVSAAGQKQDIILCVGGRGEGGGEGGGRGWRFRRQLMCGPYSGRRCTVQYSAHVCQYDEATQAAYPSKAFRCGSRERVMGMGMNFLNSKIRYKGKTSWEALLLNIHPYHFLSHLIKQKNTN
jgi:hypothetical protein